jgi:hypothetical protein
MPWRLRLMGTRVWPTPRLTPPCWKNCCQRPGTRRAVGNNPIEADHDQPQHGLRTMRGLRIDRTAAVAIAPAGEAAALVVHDFAVEQTVQALIC